MDEMAKPAIEALKTGELKFVPERFGKTYLHWLENIRDWCISRQLWWGHRIPAYYCDDCGEVVVAKEDAGDMPEVRMHTFHIRMRILWIPGSLLHCGRSPHWDGQRRHRRSGLFLSDRCTGNRIRYHLLLGYPYGILRHLSRLGSARSIMY